MSSLVPCPQCNTFVKAESLGDGTCAFCPTAKAASLRNPIPGILLAATVVAAPGCFATPVYGAPPPTDASGGEGSVGDASVDASVPDSSAPDAIAEADATP